MPKDTYANLAYGSAIEAAAGTMAFSEIQTGVAIFEKVAWLINRIDYFFSKTYVNLILDNADAVSGGLTTSNTLVAFELSDPSLLDMHSIGAYNLGAAASGALYPNPIVKDLSGLPGGGILVPPSPIYVAVRGISLAAVMKVEMRIHFTFINLKPEEYWELVESRRIII